MTAPTIGGPTSPPTPAAVYSAPRIAPSPTVPNSAGGDRRRQGDEAAVADAHHDREQHEHGVAVAGAEPQQEAGREERRS